MTEIVKGLWYPQGPPPLEGESDIEYTNRLLGAGPRGQEGRPYDHRRNRQCSIGYHQECSDKLHLGVTMPDAGCGCPCHIERTFAYASINTWNEYMPIGSWVSFPEGSGEPNEQTTSKAYVDEVGWPVVEVKTFNHPLWLSWLEPVRQL